MPIKLTVEFRLKELEKQTLKNWRKQVENESAINTLFYEIDKLKKKVK